MSQGISLNEKAMLVTLSISQWTARKYDKRVSKEVTDQYHTSSDVGRFNKSLISKVAIEAIPRIANEARAFHYENSLAWGDNAERLLPSANYFIYKAKMDSFEIDFLNAVETFATGYPVFVQNSQQILNGLWNSGDYPPDYEIRGKFAFQVQFGAIPDSDDFRVQISDLEIRKIQADIEKRIFLSTSLAMEDLHTRVSTALSHIIDRLSDKDAVFRDSLITNLSDLCALLPRLNVLNDPKIDRVRRDIESRILNHVNPQVLREDHKLRRTTSETAREILDSMSGYTGLAMAA